MNLTIPNEFLQKLVDEKQKTTLEFIMKMIRTAIDSGGTVRIEGLKLMGEEPFYKTLSNVSEFENFKKLVDKSIA